VFTISPYKVFYKTAEDIGNAFPVQAGFGVSSRTFSKAADRNRIKRLGREAWRLQKHDLYLTLKENNRYIHLFFVYTSREILTYQEISDKMNLIVKRLRKELAG
jgi:ribonuclease P protein component